MYVPTKYGIGEIACIYYRVGLIVFQVSVFPREWHTRPTRLCFSLLAMRGGAQELEVTYIDNIAHIGRRETPGSRNTVNFSYISLTKDTTEFSIIIITRIKSARNEITIMQFIEKELYSHIDPV